MTITETAEAVLVHVAPADITVKSNVRSKVDDGLVNSVRELGVLEPLLVIPNGTTGSYVLLAGARRRAAAIKAKVPTVPCYVLPAGTDAAQLVQMLAENLARADLPVADQAAAFEQLEGFGLTAAEIGAATGTDEKIVATGLRVAKSKTATAVSRKHDLTLDQAAALAEFDGNDQAVKDLTSTATKNPAQFEHAVARWRQEQERLDARAKHRAKLQSEGVKILPDGESFGHTLTGPSGTALDNLKGADGKNLTVANHKTCPGHRAHIRHWGDGVSYGCIAPAKYGHKDRWSSGTRSKSAALTDREADKARQERRELIHRNKAMKIATPVRRRFVAELVKRKAAPAGTLAFVTSLLVDRRDHWITESRSEVHEAVLGSKRSTTHDDAGALVGDVKGATERRLPLLLVAKVAVAVESTWQDDLHRDTRHRKPYREAAYLRYLESVGYGLADVEQVVCLRAESKPIPKTLAAPPAPKSAARKTPAVKKAAPKKAAPKKAARKVPAKRKARRAPAKRKATTPA